jgi:DUF3052 family protein
MAGYSSTPLAKKLGIKRGFKIALINEPDYYFKLFTDLPAKIELLADARLKKDFVHFFTKDSKELSKVLPRLKNEIVSNGIIWVSWPKKTAKVASDVSEHMIRDLALSSGLVDIKVCTVDETWSGLKLVIPVKEREKAYCNRSTYAARSAIIRIIIFFPAKKHVQKNKITDIL